MVKSEAIQRVSAQVNTGIVQMTDEQIEANNGQDTEFTTIYVLLTGASEPTKFSFHELIKLDAIEALVHEHKPKPQPEVKDDDLSNTEYFLKLLAVDTYTFEDAVERFVDERAKKVDVDDLVSYLKDNVCIDEDKLECSLDYASVEDSNTISVDFKFETYDAEDYLHRELEGAVQRYFNNENK